MPQKLSGYKRTKKKLIPPLLTIPTNWEMESWAHIRMPEVLWAILIRGSLPRDVALQGFRQVAQLFYEYKDFEEILPDITLTGISLQPEEFRNKLIRLIAKDIAFDSLGSLLLFEGLPAFEIWKSNITSDKGEDELWNDLGDCVLKSFDFRSVPATDCKWARILAILASGKMYFALEDPKLSEEIYRELVEYPNYGDEQKVMSFIRAMEGTLDGLNEMKTSSAWQECFWKECFNQTLCMPIERMEGIKLMVIDRNQIMAIREALIHHSDLTIESTGVDSKHESIFGIGVYALSLIEELARFSAQNSIMGRLALRSLAELFITLKYLRHKNDQKLWQAYREYGNGQAKLQVHKIQEYGEEISHIDLDNLDAIANEDKSDRFLEIGLGNWANTNLRAMSMECDAKKEYDLFYNWTSAYNHGGWGAIRESNYTNCANPLHRFHQIPSERINTLPSVLIDAVSLCNKILDQVSDEYPEILNRISIIGNDD